MVTTGFDRPNLYFDVEKPRDKFARLLEWIRAYPGQAGIVYCSTRKNVELVCEKLIEKGISATRYHAGLSDEELGALVAWVGRESPSVVVEVGTLFGFTARALAQRTRAHVVAVDNFCWNPFGLTPDQHEAFARRVLADSDVELIPEYEEALYKRLDAQHEDILAAIRDTGDLSKETEGKLKAAIQAFTADFLKLHTDKE